MIQCDGSVGCATQGGGANPKPAGFHFEARVLLDDCVVSCSALVCIVLTVTLMNGIKNPTICSGEWCPWPTEPRCRAQCLFRADADLPELKVKLKLLYLPTWLWRHFLRVMARAGDFPA